VGKTIKGGALLDSKELIYSNRKFINFLQANKLDLIFSSFLSGTHFFGQLFRPHFFYLVERIALISLPLLLSRPFSHCRIDFLFLSQCPHSSAQYTMCFFLHPQPPFYPSNSLFQEISRSLQKYTFVNY
jgi:hypothetical protein